jgi:NADPH:quinone reductase-like Zn-dependent oxidoreductase
MKAIRISRHGGADVLERVDLPDPHPGPGEVRVRVTHVGLNHLDVWVRRGVEGHTFPLPLIPGSDVVGIREDTGEGVALHPARSCLRCSRCLAGRHDLCRQFRIRGEGMDGGCCELVVAPAEELLPCALPPEQAVALPLSLLTAWHMLIGRARIQPGDRVLVQGGAGGVGSLAIQVARLAGARVVATASTEAKRTLCESLGAERVFGYGEAIDGVRGWSDGGVDLVVDSAGAATWRDSVRMLRWGGTYATCGATAGHRVELDLRVLFFKQLSFLGSTMGSMSEMRAAWDAVAAGRIRPVVDRVLPMSRIAEAHAALENREVAGKLVLTQDL